MICSVTVFGLGLTERNLQHVTFTTWLLNECTSCQANFGRLIVLLVKSFYV